MLIKRVGAAGLAIIVVSVFMWGNMANVFAATTIAITSPSAGATLQSGNFTVTGTSTANRTISVKVNGNVAGSTIADGSGNWSLALTNQSAGAKVIEATASMDKLYANALTTSNLADSFMAKFDTFDDSSLGTFSIVSGGGPLNQWKSDNSYTRAFGVAPLLSSSDIFPIDLGTEAVSNFTMSGTTPRPSGIAFSPDDSKVYITDSVNDVVHVYNAATNAAIGSPISVGDAPIPIVTRPGHNEIWVFNSGTSDSISVINTDTDTVTDTYAVNSATANLAFSPDGNSVYLATDTIGDLIILDANTGNVTDTITGAGATIGSSIAVSSDNKRLYSAGIDTNFVRVFDLENKVFLTSIPVATGPLSLVLTSDDASLYVSLPNLIGGANGRTIAHIDTASNTVLSSITLTGAPFYLGIIPESASASVNVTVAESQLADTGSNVLLLVGISLATILSASMYIILMLRNQKVTIGRQ